jgi:hypothetical protein
VRGHRAQHGGIGPGLVTVQRLSAPLANEHEECAGAALAKIQDRMK